MRRSASGNVLEYGIRVVYSHCGVSSDNFSLPVTQMDMYGSW